MNPELANAVETPETELTPAETPETPEVELDTEGNPVDPVAVEEETDEVEHDGKKYKLPRALKPALMFQSDYTKKTMELAEQRRQLNEEFQSREKLRGEFTADIGRAQALSERIAQYDKLNWSQIRAENPAYCDQLWFDYQQTKDLAAKTAQELQQKINQRNSEQQQETAKQYDNFVREVMTAVPEMAKPEYVAKLNAFARSLGFTAQELSQVRDVRIVRALKAAYAGSQIQTSQSKQQAATTTAKVAEAAKPLPTVASRSAAGTVKPTDAASDKLSVDEWLRRRNEQVRKRG